jgi:hypothetical protein
MTYKFSARSKTNLEELDQPLQDVLNEAIKRVDFSIIKGYRPEDEQNEAYDNGSSNLRFPHGKHNKKPSKAVDIMPCPFLGWDNKEQFYKLACEIFKAATKVRVEIDWGGHWKTLVDMPHWEID